MSITDELFKMQDVSYKSFNSKLIPTINPNTVIGVRTPALRAFAKKLYREGGGAEFMASLPHNYYEENNLHAFLIEQIKDYNACIAQVNRFLPYVDNWATCDGMRPKCFKTHKQELLREINHWLKSNHTYTVRFAIGMLMVHFLDDDFSPLYLDTVAQIKSNEYYVNMMIAWYFATALAKQYNLALAYIECKKLTPWVHNKTIQKAIESFRITAEQKEYLKTLKV